MAMSLYNVTYQHLTKNQTQAINLFKDLITYGIPFSFSIRGDVDSSSSPEWRVELLDDKFENEFKNVMRQHIKPERWDKVFHNEEI